MTTSLGIGVSTTIIKRPISHPLLDALVNHWALDEFSDGSSSVSRVDAHGVRDYADIDTVTSVQETLGGVPWGRSAEFTNTNLERLENGTAPLPSPDFTLFGWIYPYPVAWQTRYPMTKDTEAWPNRELSLVIDAAGKLTCFVWNTADVAHSIDLVGVSDNVWQAVEFTVDSTNGVIRGALNNGAPVSAAFSGTPKQGSTKLIMGSYQWASVYYRFYHGRMAGWSIFDRGLTDTERAWLVGANRPRDYPEISDFTG